MIGGEFRYIRLGQPIPPGWELVADFNDCHHGRYSQGIIRKIEPQPMTREELIECCRSARRLAETIDFPPPDEKYIRKLQELKASENRCPHCGNPLIEDWNGAHYSCVTCKNVTTACCSGASEGEAG